MKFYLMLLRRGGRRLLPEELTEPPRLASFTLSSVRGLRQLKAVCCFGGSTLGELWEPVLSHLGPDEFTLRGFERSGEAGLVQEWRLKPHAVAPGDGAG